MIDSRELRSHVLELLSPVCEPLHELWERATARAIAHHREYGVALGGWQQTHLARIHMHTLVGAEPLPGLRLVEPCRNGRLMFAAQDDSTLRLLHGSHGVVPAPGKNLARIRYYEQGQLSIPYGFVGNLLGIWWADAEGGVTIRVVRPVGRWEFGAKAKVDLDLILPRTSQEFEGLEFRPDDVGLDLDVPTREVAAEAADPELFQ